MSNSIVTVFGGTGFLGSRIVRHLLDRGITVRVASRHPQRVRERFGEPPTLHSVMADVNDADSVGTALSGASAAVNTVSLYVERGRATFHRVHVEAARQTASLARENHLQHFTHVSGIGAEIDSSSPYIRSRALGEQAVLEEFPGAIVVRPAVMFGPGDAFLTPIQKLLRQLPVYPMFGRGDSRLQPVHVDDVAKAIAQVSLDPPRNGPMVICAGPRVYTYHALLRTLAHAAGLRTRLVPVPYPVWDMLAWFAEFLPSPPLTRGQVDLMKVDSVSDLRAQGLEQLGIEPRSIEEFLSAAAAAQHIKI